MKARRAITQSILQRQNRLGKKKLAVFRDLWSYEIQHLGHWSPRRRKMAGLGEIMAANTPNLAKDTNVQIQDIYFQIG